MTIKLEAAYHEAGHALAAHLSKFHGLAHDINLHEYGAGEALIMLRKSKLTASGLAASAASAANPDVARDLGQILVAGLIAEKIAASRHSNITPNPTCAEPDYALLAQILAAAKLSKKFDKLEREALELLSKHWETVEKLAQHLFEHAGGNLLEIEAIIDSDLN